MKQTEGLYRFARFLKQLAIGIITLAVAVAAFGYLFFIRQVNVPEAWREADRELHNSMLRYGETPDRIAHVYIRRPTNYFRGANGLLVATPRRVLFIGIEPKDQLASPDAPSAIITSEFANDTLLKLTLSRVYALTAHGVVIQRQGRKETYGANRGHEAELDSLVSYVNGVHAAQQKEAAAEHLLRARVADLMRRPLKYRVTRGDALSTIATRFGATQAQIQAWNHMTGDRVRIGDTLLVKPAG